MANVSSSNSQGVRVPKLRFPGFEGEWESNTLGMLGSFTKGATLSKADITETGTPFILYGELYTTYGEVTTSIARTTDKTADKEQYSQVGDVIIPTSGETPEEIATATCVMLPDVILAGDLNIYRNKDVDGRIISYIINHVINGDISRIAQGKSVVHIKADDLSKLSINYPSAKEQKKLINFLSLIDRRIVKQQALIESLKSYKRGLLFKVLTEKITLTDDEWATHKIGDFLSSKSIKQLPSKEVPLMAFTATGGVCEKGERYDRGFLVKDENTKLYKRTDYGDFIYSSNNLDVGSIGLNLYGSAVISDVYEIFTIEHADRWFINEAIKQKKTLNDILKYRQGCLYGQYRIYADDFLTVNIKVPPIEVQKKIGSLFARIDSKIGSAQSVFELLELLKASLLQQLFI